MQNVADQLGLWKAQRARALAKVINSITQAAHATTHWKPAPSQPDYTLRIEIALWENDLDAALAFTHQGLCHQHLLITLATRLESTRPADAINLYRRVVAPTIEQTNNSAYQEAIKLLRKIGQLMTLAQQSGLFVAYLSELRQQYKQKRNFIKLLDVLAGMASK